MKRLLICALFSVSLFAAQSAQESTVSISIAVTDTAGAQTTYTVDLPAGAIAAIQRAIAATPTGGIQYAGVADLIIKRVYSDIVVPTADRYPDPAIAAAVASAVAAQAAAKAAMAPNVTVK